MSSCHTWSEFKPRFNIMVDRANGQTELNFDEIESKIEKIETKPVKVNSFDNKLKKALSFNPKNDGSEDEQIHLDL